MKLLHSADWHLDSPLSGSENVGLRQQLLRIPHMVAQLAVQEQCDLVLLSGDLFDGEPSAETAQIVQKALGSIPMPVFISPGNHDPLSLAVWRQTQWPENVHIFSSLESVALPALSCRVWGAGFRTTESEALLKDFRAEGAERYALGVFHGDPTQTHSPYNPVTHGQVLETGLTYLALGHIHKAGSFRAGDTLCAWPGCAMGRGFDETGEKGVLILTLEDTCESRFVPLPLPRFHWLETTVDGLAAQLPAAPTQDHYRVELVGEWEQPDLQALKAQFAHIPNLWLRDRTLPPLALWGNAGEDTLEGVYFSLLRQSDAPPEIREQAARISQQLLSGREVVL